MRDEVWYAAYGSNLCRSRLSCYLQGGTPEGATRTYPGCADPAPPKEEAVEVMPYRLYFAGRSTVWSGSVAFVETAPDAAVRTHVRLYRLGLSQLEDIHAQDNRGGERARIDVEELRSRRVVFAAAGWYGTFVLLGERDGLPVVTFTAASVESVGELGAPSPAYLRTIAAGLCELDGLSREYVARYLASAPGASGRLSEADVISVLSRNS